MIYGRHLTFFLVNLVATLASIPVSGAVPAGNQPVTLAWTASPSSTIAGYRLYYGGASHDYTDTVEVGASTTVTVSNLAVGVTYFFAVTAYDIIGIESAFSDEISYAIPEVARLALRPSALGQLLLTGRGPVGYGYSLQLSADLQHWSDIGSVTMDAKGAFQFTDPVPETNTARYYRLRQTSP